MGPASTRCLLLRVSVDLATCEVSVGQNSVNNLSSVVRAVVASARLASLFAAAERALTHLTLDENTGERS